MKIILPQNKRAKEIRKILKEVFEPILIFLIFAILVAVISYISSKLCNIPIALAVDAVLKSFMIFFCCMLGLFIIIFLMGSLVDMVYVAFIKKDTNEDCVTAK